MTLKDTYLKKGRKAHDREANKAFDKNPKSFKSKFTPSQIKEIEKGQKPTGYTWHHHQTRGVMQLVK